MPLPWSAYLILLWLFAFGACFGSFLNVVIYRIPAGLSLIHPGSHCPKCSHAIRAYDNVPILGWCWLRGLCRDCKAFIPIRYPLVEGLIGIVFVLVGLPDIVYYGVTLPDTPASGFPDMDRLAWFPSGTGSLWFTYVAHLWAICTLIAIAFMQLDGKSPPARFLWFTLAMSLGLSLLPLVIKPVPIAISQANLPWLVGPVGAIVGLLIGGAAFPVVRMVAKIEGSATPFAAALVGIAFGWQATLLLTPVVSGLWLADGLMARLEGVRKRVPWTVYLAGCTLVYLGIWPIVVRYLPFPGHDPHFLSGAK